jgi:outer membrane protein assembly factor BamB
MAISPNFKHQIWISVAIILVHISCSKPPDNPGNPGNPGNPNRDTTSTKTDHKLQPFSAQIVFLQPDQAIVSWSASKDSLNDTIRYKILLAGKIVDSNLTRLNDTLKSISPGLTYKGSVIAYNRYNDTISASFNLGPSSKAYAYFFVYPGYTIQCQDLYANQPVWTSIAGGNQIPFTGTPVVVNDTLYANYNDVSNVFALSASTGNVIWKSPEMYINPNMAGPALVDGGPIYSSGKLYIGTQHGITCLNSTTGQILWADQDGSDYYTTPVVDGGKVFVGTYTYHYTGIPDTFAYKAIDANTGATIWKQLTAQSTSYPIACNGVLVYYDVNSSYTALNENSGAQVWTKPMSNSSTNAVHYNNLLICWTDSQLCGLDISTGAIVWQVPAYQYGEKADPFVSHDTIFASEDYTGSLNQFQLLAVRAGTGEVLWTKKTTESQPYSLCAAGGMIYMTAMDDFSLNVYSTKDGSFIQNVNARSGAIVLNGGAYYSAASGMVQ